MNFSVCVLDAKLGGGRVSNKDSDLAEVKIRTEMAGMWSAAERDDG